MAVPFNPERLEVTGSPGAVIGDVMQAAHALIFPLDSGAGQFSVSPSGSFVYLPGGILPLPDRSVLWVDRPGTERPIPVPPRTYSSVRLSPDGQRFAFATLQLGDRNVWVSDILRGSLTRLTDDGRNEGPSGHRMASASRSLRCTGRALMWC